MKKILPVLLAAVLLFTAAGCGANPQQGAGPSGNPVSQSGASPEAAPEGSGPFAVTDSRGVDIIFDKIPETIVSLTPSNTEILYALGMEEKIIAVSDYCNYPEETASKQKLPTGEQLDLESLISLNPDVVFLGNMSVMDDQMRRLEESGIKLVVTEANTLAETYEVMGLIGKITGKAQEASAMADAMKKGFEEIREEVRGKAQRTVYVEVSPLQYGLWSCGKNTFIQELIDIVGAKNIFDDVEGWTSVSEEQVLQRNPDIILTTASPLTGIKDPIGDIVSRQNWSGISAVKNNKVVMLDSDMSTRPGPRLLDAAKALVQIIYGE